MSGLAAVQRLMALGYRFQAEGDMLRYEWRGTHKPDPSQVRPLLALVKEHKPEVISFLAKKPEAGERVLTCFECPHFRPAVNSPNPTQAWGHCRKRNKGRFGVAMACEAILTSPDGP
jgi:hypothetical protein